jgi:ATP-dependent Lhr-like helicase
VDLLLERWCEPPLEGGLHLSTLVQQTLSIIAQESGATAQQLYLRLCKEGAFQEVDAETYAEFLRDLGAADLITQMHEGTLVMGLEGERLVSSYEFYAAFDSAEEVTLQAGATALGRMPVSQPLVPGNMLAFAGRPWRIVEFRRGEGVCLVEPGTGGNPPVFVGTSACVHDEVRQRMRDVWRSTEEPAYLGAEAARLLAEGRERFDQLGLRDGSVVPHERDVLLFPWAGDRVLHTLAVWLNTGGMKVGTGGLALRVERCETGELLDRAADLVEGGVPDPVELARSVLHRQTGKHSVYLSEELACRDYASIRLDVHGALEALRRIL